MVNIGTTNLMQRNWPESVPWTEKKLVLGGLVWFLQYLGQSSTSFGPHYLFLGQKTDKTRPVNTSLEGLSQDALKVS